MSRLQRTTQSEDRHIFLRITVSVCLLVAWTVSGMAQDLSEIRANGAIRHLGVPYAHFVDGNGDGFDSDLVHAFAEHLGVRYEYAKADWNNVIQDLIGSDIQYHPETRTTGTRQVRGDIIANGLTVLPSREKLIAYSAPTFASAVWLLARTDSRVTPITPQGNLVEDIRATKAKLAEGDTFVVDDSCLDPKLYGLEGRGYSLRHFSSANSQNDLVPAILKREGEMTLLDVPDIIVAMGKWPGKIKVIGPISDEQPMAAGFRKTSPELRRAFDEFLSRIKADGTYMKLVRKHYRLAPTYMPRFFNDPSIKH